MFVFYVLCVFVVFYVLLFFMFIHSSFSLRSILLAFCRHVYILDMDEFKLCNSFEDEFHGLKFFNLIVDFFEMSMVSK
jgi:hypothetical protein